jgi:mannosyltransferase OCH1-like enzyme
VLIPRIFHQIWLGDTPRSRSFVWWHEAWKALHPTWEMRLWQQSGDDAVEAGDFKFISNHPEMLARACHLSQRSNILRYELIERFGGVYMDIDMEPLRSIEPLIDGVSAFTSYMGMFGSGKPPTRLGCALFGAVPGHRWVHDLVSQMKTEDPAIHKSLGDSYFTRVTADHSDVKVFDPHVFYATDRTRRDSYTVHHWSGGWWTNSYKPLHQIATTVLFG